MQKKYKYLDFERKYCVWNNYKKGESTMLKITKVVVQSTANMSGCGKQNDMACGIRAKLG